MLMWLMATEGGERVDASVLRSTHYSCGESKFGSQTHKMCLLTLLPASSSPESPPDLECLRLHIPTHRHESLQRGAVTCSQAPRHSTRETLLHVDVPLQKPLAN